MQGLINIVTPFLTVEALKLSFVKTLFSITVSKSWSAFLWRLIHTFLHPFLSSGSNANYWMFSFFFLPLLLFTISFLEYLSLQGFLSVNSLASVLILFQLLFRCVTLTVVMDFILVCKELSIKCTIILFSCHITFLKLYWG